MKSNTRARHKHKQQLFTSLYGQLYQYVYDCQPSLLFGDADSVLSLVANDLRSYSGKLTPDAMTKWANRLIERHAKRYADAGNIYTQHKPSICKAIRKTMPYGLQDSAVTKDEDIAQEVALRVFTEAESLAETDPSKHTAKQSTRVYAMAKTHTLLYYSIPMRRQFNLLMDRVAEGDAPYGDNEVWSDQEWAAMKITHDERAA